jgi:hypothetical protein
MADRYSIDPAMAAAAWLGSLNVALDRQSATAVVDLFTENCYWRDVVAFSWDVQWVHGREGIARVMLADIADLRPRGFVVSEANTGPTRVTRVGREVIEVFHAFRTNYGSGKGIVRLVADDSSPIGVRAWTILTTLQCWHGDEPRPAGLRRAGRGFDRTATTQTWAQRRAEIDAFENRDPDVLIVGGGQAGVMVATQLGEMGVEALVVDRHSRIGDNWHRRYDFLGLHTQTDLVHFALMPFPDAFAAYLPKDKLAKWFEHYVEALDISYWPNTEFVLGQYDDGTGRWVVTLSAGGSEARMRLRHMVMAMGTDPGTPNRPRLPGLETFTGPVLHTSEFRTGAPFAANRVLQRLRASGMRIDCSADETGYVMKLHRNRGGYYIDVGCSELITRRQIGLLQYEQIENWVPSGLLLRNGTRLEFDAVILARGYINQQANLTSNFGADVAAKVGTVLGLDENGEYANTFRPTAQRGLWFSGGRIATCRQYSRYLAVQIKGRAERCQPPLSAVAGPAAGGNQRGRRDLPARAFLEDIRPGMGVPGSPRPGSFS